MLSGWVGRKEDVKQGSAVGQRLAVAEALCCQHVPARRTILRGSFRENKKGRPEAPSEVLLRRLIDLVIFGTARAFAAFDFVGAPIGSARAAVAGIGAALGDLPRVGKDDHRGGG
jgi:hypothetical protein